jgi:hypothetical protein
MQFDYLAAIKKIDLRYKCAFITAFVTGILAQGMGLFNKYSVHDDPMNYGVGFTYTSGRWMLDVLANLEKIFYGDGHYSLPTFNGGLAILFIAISACLVINIIEIESPLLSSFIAGIMVSFPVITSIFGYMFTLHFYMIALFFSVLGVYCICKSDRWYIWCIGVILMTSSVGIYQAFIPVTITVVLFYLINFVLKNDCKQAIIRKILLSGVCCIVFMLLYFLINKVYLSSHDAVLTSYKGIDSMGKSSIVVYLRRAVYCYIEFFVPNTKAKYCMYPGNIFGVYIVIVLLSIALSILILIDLFRTNRLRGIVFAILVAFIPLCVNFIFVMAGRMEVHSLMIYSQLMPFVYFVWVLENVKIEKKLIAKGVSIASVILIASLQLMYLRLDNKCYLKATYAQQEAISYLTSLVSSIKGVEGYDDDYSVVFVNEKKITDKSLQFGDNGALEDIEYFPYCYDVNGYINDYAWIEFMKQWTGYSPTIIDEAPFAEMDEVKKMPSYPDDGSIAIINNTVVVKF